LTHHWTLGVSSQVKAEALHPFLTPLNLARFFFFPFSLPQLPLPFGLACISASFPKA